MDCKRAARSPPPLFLGADIGGGAGAPGGGGIGGPGGGGGGGIVV